MRCWIQNGPVQVFTRYRTKLGPEQFRQNWTCFLAGLKIGPKLDHKGGTGIRSRVNRRPIRTDLRTETGAEPNRKSVPCEVNLL